MTDEELLAEEYICNGKCQDDITKNYVHCKTCTRLNDFLAGLKAGRPQWHKVTDCLPISNKDKMYFVVDKYGARMFARFYDGVWSNYTVINDIVKWCELPKE